MATRVRTKQLTAPSETLEHRKAMMYYYALGKDRTLAEVAKAFRVGHATVNQWSSQFKWGPRIIEMDKATADRLKFEDPQKIVEFHKDILFICDAFMADQKSRVVLDLEGNPCGYKDDAALANPLTFDKFFELRHRALRTEPYPDLIPEKKGRDGATTAIQINISKD